MKLSIVPFGLLALSLVACQREATTTANSAAASTSAAQAVSDAQVPPPSSAAIAGTPNGTVMTPAYVETVGRMAYLWAWPLVNNANRAASMAAVPEPGHNGGIVPVAPHGQISMLNDYIAPGQNFVTCPNQDTVYGAGYANVSKQPVIVQVPDAGDRFFTYQIVDARTDSFCRVGKQWKTKPGFYLLVGPGWKDKVPEGVAGVCRSSTDLVTILPRFFMDDTPQDRAAIQPLVNQVMVYPLAQYDGKMKTKDWSKVPSFPAAASAGGGEIKWVVPERFFDQLPEVMSAVPPLPGEEAMYATVRAVLDAAEKDPKIKEALVKTAVESEAQLIAPLFDFRNNGRPVGNGWTSPPNGARWGVDYLSRTATAKSNMYDNAPEETRYIYTDFDSDGARLNGAGGGTYTVTFPKGGVPPVKGFWSLTMYNKHHLFEPNTLNRFSLGTKSKQLKYNDDGSLTLYVQKASPGAERESNWLPAPSDEFSLYIRAYWPDAAILDGTWKPPQVRKTQA